MNRYNGYRTETMDTIVHNLARGDPHLKKLIHARVGAPRIPPEFEGTEIIYEDLPRGGKHAHRRKSMSKCKSKKTRRTRNTRKRLRNYH